jgi:hypothetical protein
MKKLLILTVVVTLTLLAVPATASEVVLLTANSSGSLVGSIGGTALFQQHGELSGTGVFPAFVQVAGGGSPTVHEAYNTGTNNVYDNGSSPTFNHAITLSQVGTDLTGLYYEFFLDINESDNTADKYLSLDALVVSTGTDPNPSTETPSPGITRWAMASTDVILLNYDLESGSGDADMIFRVPKTAFANVALTDNVYLYSKFGSLGLSSLYPTASPITGANWGNSDGFEEWAYSREKVEVPDGGVTALMLGMSLLGLRFVSRRRK